METNSPATIKEFGPFIETAIREVFPTESSEELMSLPEEDARIKTAVEGVTGYSNTRNYTQKPKAETIKESNCEINNALRKENEELKAKLKKLTDAFNSI